MTWKGKPIDTMTREELIAALAEAVNELRVIRATKPGGTRDLIRRAKE